MRSLITQAINLTVRRRKTFTIQNVLDRLLSFNDMFSLLEALEEIDPDLAKFTVDSLKEEIRVVLASKKVRVNGKEVRQFENFKTDAKKEHVWYKFPETLDSSRVIATTKLNDKHRKAMTAKVVRYEKAVAGMMQRPGVSVGSAIGELATGTDG